MEQAPSLARGPRLHHQPRKVCCPQGRLSLTRAAGKAAEEPLPAFPLVVLRPFPEPVPLGDTKAFPEFPETVSPPSVSAQRVCVFLLGAHRPETAV